MTIQYGLDGEQAVALETAVVTMLVRIAQLEVNIRFNKKQISGESAMTLERGNFYKRHVDMIEADEQVIEVLRKSISEIQQILKTIQPSVIKVGEPLTLIDNDTGERYEGVVSSFTEPNSVSLKNVKGIESTKVLMFNFSLDLYTIEVPREAEEEGEYL